MFNNIFLMPSFPKELKNFIDSVEWTFAKTMPRWPHYYIVRKKVDETLFVRVVEHIRSDGYQGWFYKKPITYFNEDSLVYWTMGEPIEKTTIINRTSLENSYEYRLKNNTLPDEE